MEGGATAECEVDDVCLLDGSVVHSKCVFGVHCETCGCCASVRVVFAICCASQVTRGDVCVCCPIRAREEMARQCVILVILYFSWHKVKYS